MARKANLKKGIKGPQKMRYQMGGDFMEPDKELKFGGIKYQYGGAGKQANYGSRNPTVERQNKDLMSYLTPSERLSLKSSDAKIATARFRQMVSEEGSAFEGIRSKARDAGVAMSQAKRAIEKAVEAQKESDARRAQNKPTNTPAKAAPQSAYEAAAKAAAAKYGPSKGQGVARPATPTSAYMAASDKATGRSSAPAAKPSSPVSKPSTPAAKPKSSGFSDAFAAARKAGKTTFTYNGKSYGTRKAGETQEQYRAALGKASGTSSKPTSMQPVQRREAGQVSRQQPTLQTPNPPKLVATNKINSSSSNKKQMGGMVKGNKMTAKPPMKPIGKKNNTKTTKL